MDDRNLLGAYLLYYWPVSYMQVSLALAEHPIAPRRVLDLGSGPGPASAAVIDACEASAGGLPLERLVLVDKSAKALTLAKTIIAESPGRSARIETVELDLESGAKLPEGPFDLIVMGHCLNELWRSAPDVLERRAGLAERAAESLAPDGRMLLVEPALLATCRDLIALRDRLASRAWHILGPCPGSYPCPALAAGPERSCHAESPWKAPEPLASLARAAGLDRESVKFAFFSLTPKEKLEARTPSDASRPLANDRRVVSEPMLNKAGRLRYVLCGAGRLETLSARADDADTRAREFIGLRRGDILRAEGLEVRQGGGFGLLPESRLEVVARAPEASS
jgi:SAM-dependent methyltransferase